MWSDDRRYVSRDRLIELLGAQGAARVVDVFGGSRIYVPEPDTESFAPIAAKLGDETARKLCYEFGGLQVVLPARLVATRQEIVRLRAEGVRPAEIARRLGCAERYVYYVLAAPGAAQRSRAGESASCVKK
jgi:hypothetical protein